MFGNVGDSILTLKAVSINFEKPHQNMLYNGKLSHDLCIHNVWMEK